jgi:hypothetical protein
VDGGVEAVDAWLADNARPAQVPGDALRKWLEISVRDQARWRGRHGQGGVDLAVKPHAQTGVPQVVGTRFGEIAG